ncbi:MAG: toll/interleukin-1 receptor domain-containing protein [Pseudomonadota bacterium]
MKTETAILKISLRLFGVSCFVAHEDIQPTKEWQVEIENALASMDGLVALMTDNFHVSDWTDQEVGFAFARGVPIIAVRLGKDPYGFIGKFQGLAGNWETCAEDIAKLLIKNDRMFAAYIEALRNCGSFDQGNRLANIFSGIERLSSQQIDELVRTFNGNSELQGSFGFNGSNPRQYGAGLAPLLNRMGNRKFELVKSRIIDVVW